MYIEDFIQTYVNMLRITPSLIRLDHFAKYTCTPNSQIMTLKNETLRLDGKMLSNSVHHQRDPNHKNSNLKLNVHFYHIIYVNDKTKEYHYKQFA